jgi:lariat debranching enzyme
MQLLRQLRPRFWFSGHLHVKFAALVVHDEGEAAPAAPAPQPSAAAGFAAPAPPCPPAPLPAADTIRGDGGAAATRFLALDKPLPGRQFLQVLDVPLRPGAAGAGAACFAYDAEWLAILARTHPLEPAAKRYPRLPPPTAASASEIAAVEARLRAAGLGARDAAGREFFPVPENFSVTAPPFVPNGPRDAGQFRSVGMPAAEGSPQTDELLRMLGLPHGLTVPFGGGHAPGAGAGVGAGSGAGVAGVGALAAGVGALAAAAFVGAAASGAAVVADANEIALD